MVWPGGPSRTRADSPGDPAPPRLSVCDVCSPKPAHGRPRSRAMSHRVNDTIRNAASRGLPTATRSSTTQALGRRAAATGGAWPSGDWPSGDLALGGLALGGGEATSGHQALLPLRAHGAGLSSETTRWRAARGRGLARHQGAVWGGGAARLGSCEPPCPRAPSPPGSGARAEGGAHSGHMGGSSHRPQRAAPDGCPGRHPCARGGEGRAWCPAL